MRNYLTSKQVRERYQLSNTTLWRWVNNEIIPPPLKIETRRYWRADVLDAVDDAYLKNESWQSAVDNLPSYEVVDDEHLKRAYKQIEILKLQLKEIEQKTDITKHAAYREKLLKTELERMAKMLSALISIL